MQLDVAEICTINGNLQTCCPAAATINVKHKPPSLTLGAMLCKVSQWLKICLLPSGCEYTHICNHCPHFIPQSSTLVEVITNADQMTQGHTPHHAPARLQHVPTQGKAYTQCTAHDENVAPAFIEHELHCASRQHCPACAKPRSQCSFLLRTVFLFCQQRTQLALQFQLQQ